MKLYILRVRDGTVIESFRIPMAITPAEIQEGTISPINIPKWLEIPEMVGLPGYPNIQVICWWATYFYNLYRITYGIVGTPLHSIVNMGIAHLAANYHWAWTAKWLISVIVPVAVVAGILYLWNPAFETRKYWEEQDQRTANAGNFHYIMTYKEKMWWADLWAMDPARRGYYHRCSEISGVRMWEKRNTRTFGYDVDWWELGKTVTQRTSAWLQYRRYVWDTFFVEYLGVMNKISPGLYALQPQYKNKYLETMPHLYKKPTPELCKEPFPF